MPESNAKNHPSLAEYLLDRMGVDRTGIRQSEALDLLMNVIDSEAEPPPNDSTLQRHRKVNGVRCGSPAMSGGPYCYFHFHIYTGDTQHLPVIEDGNSIAFVMGTIVRELASGRLEVPRANSMLYAMQNTAALLKYLDFEPDPQLLEDQEDEEPANPMASTTGARFGESEKRNE